MKDKAMAIYIFIDDILFQKDEVEDLPSGE